MWCGLAIFVSAVICGVSDRHTELLFRYLLVNTSWVPDDWHQDACCILCFIILLFWGQGLPVKRGEPGRAGAGGDRKAISPTATLDTDLRLHASPWNITPPHPPLQPHHTQPWGSSAAIIILHLAFPAYLVRLGRYRADWFLAGWGTGGREGRGWRGGGSKGANLFCFCSGCTICSICCRI